MRNVIVLATLFVGFCISLPIEKNPTNLQHIMLGIQAPNSVKCEVCKYTVKIINVAFKSGVGKKQFKKLAKYICNKFKIETPRVCGMVIEQFADWIWSLFVNSIFVPNEICGITIGKSCAVKTKFFTSWNITVPKQTKTTPSSSNIGVNTGEAPTMKIIHLSDTHLDNEYMEGSVAECNEPLCCRRNDGKAPSGKPAAGKYGYPGFCDTNVLMLNTMFKHMKHYHDDADYIYWTGDVPPHNIWNQSKAFQKAAIRQAARVIKQYFPTKKVFPVLGNHEGVPVNSFPPPEIWSWTIPSDEWLFNELAEVWGQWLPEECQATIKRGGYYTTPAQKGLRIVSLNTNYAHSDNWWLILKSDDPAGQLKWLTQVLLQAEEDGEKVHILGHVPTNALLKWWSYNYYKIVDRFRHTITGQFFGHTHHDEYRIFYDMKTHKTPINIEYLGPSVTTYHELNNGYRVYEMDGREANSSLSVVDHHTYFFDLTKAKKTEKPDFELEYSAKKDYGLKDLSPHAWDDLVHRMRTDDDLFQIFYKAYYKQHIKGKCVGDCKKNYLCTLRSAGEAFHDFCNFTTKEHIMYSLWQSEIYNKC